MAMLLCSASWTNNTEPLKRHLISIFMNAPEKKMPPKIARLSAALRPGAQRPTNGEEERNWVIGAPTGNRTLLQTHRQVRRNPVRALVHAPVRTRRAPPHPQGAGTRCHEGGNRCRAAADQ